MDGLISGGLKTGGGGFNVGFYSMVNAISYLEYMAAHSMNFCRTGWALWLNWLGFFKKWICISCKMKNTQTLASALRRIVSLLNECIPKWILETSTPVLRLLVNCRWSTNLLTGLFFLDCVSSIIGFGPLLVTILSGFIAISSDESLPVAVSQTPEIIEST